MAATLIARENKIRTLAENDDLDTYRVIIKGQKEACRIIKLRISEDVLLNHGSHRIKAQLESDPTSRALIEADPESAEAQEAIAEVLRGTGRFQDLKMDLARPQGQKEPGIVTRDGRLINANTRAVALMDLGEEFIEVAVLPPGLDALDIVDIELGLQVAETFEQEYSVTNELLFIDDLINEYGRSETDVAVRLGMDTSTTKASQTSVKLVQQKVRILKLIRDIQLMGSGSPHLVFFDSRLEALQQLDIEFERLMGESRPQQAEALKASRVLAMLANVGYNVQRQISEDWYAEFFEPVIEDGGISSDFFDAVASVPPAHGSAPAGPEESGGDAGPFAGDSPTSGPAPASVLDAANSYLASSAESSDVQVETPSGEIVFDRVTLVGDLSRAITTAVDVRKREAQAGTKIALPASYASSAATQLRSALKSLREVSSDPAFNESSLVEAAASSERALQALQDAIGEL